MATFDDQHSISPWGDLDLDAALSDKFSDIINDDFLIVDGLNVNDDLVVLSATAMFDEDDNVIYANKSNEVQGTEREDKPRCKAARMDRSRSPIPKRSRPDCTRNFEATPPKVTPRSSPARKVSLDELRQGSKRALDQLAVSMRRSEITRSEIIKFKNATKKLTARPNADDFLSGSQSTLTSALAQSRKMLKRYTDALQNPPSV